MTKSKVFSMMAHQWAESWPRRLVKLILKLPQIVNLANVAKSFYCLRDYGLQTFIEKVRNRLDKIIYRDSLYHLWIEKNEPKEKELERQRNHKLKYEPVISVIIPTFNTPKRFLLDAITSVLCQTYSRWELCIADGGSQKQYVKETLKTFSEKDNRIKVKFLPKNKGIAENSNEALSLATGDLITFLDHDDTLAPFSFFEIIRAINLNPDADFIYSDEDKISRTGKRLDPHFKPDWSPALLRSHNYITHLAVIRKKVIDEVGSFRVGYDGSQDYDLFLRVAEITAKIAHVPKVLYHWRMTSRSAASTNNAKPFAYVAEKKAIKDSLKRRKVEAEVDDGITIDFYRVQHKLAGNPTVSIIIATRDSVGALRRCVQSVLDKTQYDNYRILIVDNQSREPQTSRYYEEIVSHPKVGIAKIDGLFNRARINNYAVSLVDSEYIIFLDDVTEIISQKWLTAMLEHAQRKDIGIVGALLYYPNNTIHHAGIIIGIGGTVGYSFRRFPRHAYGYMNRARIVQNLSAVTGACLATKREVFKEVGGFDERYRHAFSDVDFCLKIRGRGYLIVYTPYAELYHHGSLGRDHERAPERQAEFKKEIEYFQRKWQAVLAKGDPYYNPNL
ncbi:MAG: glycosyltransferase, partial [Deltaproteobacteria bacterium]|nr:glycosyltransferase [Deltaproteobacteria bacterium]